MMHHPGISCRGNAESHPSAVMPRFPSTPRLRRGCGLRARRSFSGGGKRGIQYSRGFSVKHCRFWNTGSPGQVGRWHRICCL